MASQTVEEFKAALAACDFRQPDQVSKLVTASYTNVAFSEKVEERQIANPLGAYNYFGGLLGKEVWPDGQGMDLIREYYADPYIPFTFSHFVRQSAICDPNLANECVRDRCLVPEGGRGTLPPFVFYKAGLKTQRDCVANIRHIKNFRWWASRVIRSRELMDEQMMNMFYTMAGIQTSGNKIVLQGFRDANGALKMLPSSDPRNPLRFGLYNYMEEKFPQITNINDLAPLTVDVMESLARYWAQFPKNNEIAKGPRGENIYEFWYPDDWYQAEAVRNSDYMEKLKIMMPAKLFSGYSLAEGEREVVGNWAPRVMPWLPRFAPTADGKIVPVDTHVGVNIEVGQEFVGSVEFENAPIGLANIVSGKQGTILSRPPLTESGAGFPIMPITGDSGWRIRNDYDKECNPDLNMPYSEKDYEMGVRMDDPQAAVSFLFRRRIFNMRPINDCDLAPIFNVDPNTVDCEITTIGCQNGKRRMDDDITGNGDFQYVTCTAASCGNTEEAPFTYIVKIERRPNQPDYNSLGCVCGDAVNLFVYDEDGVYNRQIQGIYKSDALSFPYARYFVETTEVLAEGECIKGISCTDATPDIGNVIDAWDSPDVENTVIFILDSPLEGCGLTDDVAVKYYSSSDVLLGTITGTINGENVERYQYNIVSVDPLFQADPEQAYAGTSYVTVTCTEV